MKFLHGIPVKKEEKNKSLGNTSDISFIPIDASSMLTNISSETLELLTSSGVLESLEQMSIDSQASNDGKEINLIPSNRLRNLDIVVNENDYSLNCNFLLQTALDGNQVTAIGVNSTEVWDDVSRNRVAVSYDNKYASLASTPISRDKIKKSIPIRKGNVDLGFSPPNVVDLSTIDKREEMMRVADGVPLSIIENTSNEFLLTLIENARSIYIPFVGLNWINYGSPTPDQLKDLFDSGLGYIDDQLADSIDIFPSNSGASRTSNSALALSHENLSHLHKTGATNIYNYEFVPTRFTESGDGLIPETPYVLLTNKVGETDIEFIFTCKNNNVTRLIVGNEDQLALAGYISPLQLNYFSLDDVKRLNSFFISSISPYPRDINERLNTGIKYGKYINQIPMVESSIDGKPLGSSFGGNGSINIAEKNARITLEASKEITKNWLKSNRKSTETLFNKPKIDLLTFFHEDHGKFLDVRLPRPREIQNLNGKEEIVELGSFYSYAYSDTNTVSIFASLPFSQSMKDVAEALENSTSIISEMVNKHRNTKDSNHLGTGTNDRQRISDARLKQNNVPLLDQAQKNVGLYGVARNILRRTLDRLRLNTNEDVFNRITLSAMPFLDTAVATASPFSKNLTKLIRDNNWTGVTHTRSKGKLFDSLSLHNFASPSFDSKYNITGREIDTIGYGPLSFREIADADQSKWNKLYQFNARNLNEVTGLVGTINNSQFDLQYAEPNSAIGNPNFVEEYRQISGDIRRGGTRSFDLDKTNNRAQSQTKSRPRITDPSEVKHIITPEFIERAVGGSSFKNATASGGLLTPSRLLNMELPRGIETWSVGTTSFNIAVPLIPILSARANESLILMNKKGGNKRIRDLSVRIFEPKEIVSVASALSNYYEEAVLVGKRNQSLGLKPDNLFTGIIGADQQMYTALTLFGNVKEDSKMECRREYYSLRYISLLQSICRWLLSNRNPKKDKIKNQLLPFDRSASVKYIELTDKIFDLLRVIYTGQDKLSDFSDHSFVEKMKFDTDKDILNSSDEVFKNCSKFVATGETKFYNLCLHEEKHFKELFREYVESNGRVLEEDFTRQGEIVNCMTSGEAQREINSLQGAPIVDYLGSLGYDEARIFRRVCEAIHARIGSGDETLEDLRFKASNFSQAQIATTVSLLTAGAIAPNEWMQRLSKNGKLELGLMPIANAEALIAQIARTASESGIENVKDLLAKFLPDGVRRSVDVDGLVDAVDTLVDAERDATDNALFSGSVADRNNKIVLGIIAGLFAVGGVYYYSKKKKLGNR